MEQGKCWGVSNSVATGIEFGKYKIDPCEVSRIQIRILLDLPTPPSIPRAKKFTEKRVNLYFMGLLKVKIINWVSNKYIEGNENPRAPN